MLKLSAKLVKLPAFFSRPALERHILLEAFLTLWFVRFGLWLLPFGVLLRLVRRSLGKAPDVELDRLTTALTVAGHYVPRATCLPRALAGQYLLATHGYPSRLRLGVRKSGDRLSAHAWLEHQGRVVIGRVSNLSDYRLLSSEGEQL